MAEHRADGSIILRSTLALEPHPASWNDRLAGWASQSPDRIFLTEADGQGGRRAICYADTLAAVRAIGAGLLGLGMEPARPLAILAENSIDCALVTLAAMWVGIPASPISPAYALKAREFGKLAGVLEALAPGVLYVADGELYGAAVRGALNQPLPVISGGAPVLGLATTPLATLRATSPGADEATAHAGVTGDSVAKILFTSGSSGAPKPVILPHRMLAVNRQQNCQIYPFLLDAPPVMVDWLPWHHTFGGNNNLGTALWCGGTYHIDDGAPTPEGVGRTLALLAAHPPTFYLNTPGAFAALVPRLEEDRALAGRFFERLQLVQYGGAVLPEHVWRALDALAVRSTGQRILIVSGIGSTECGPVPVQSSWEQHRKPEAGLPVPGVEAKLVPSLDSWELRLRGPCVTPGYWRRSELNEAAFDEEGFFRLGDAVKPVDPNDFAHGLLFDGRISDNFKLASGTWVQAAALRAALIAALSPLLKDAVLTGHDAAEIGAIGFADMIFARTLVHDACADDAALLAHPVVRNWVQGRLTLLAGAARGSSERVARLVLDAEPPSFDNGELTDKGVAAARIVLARRAALVARLHATCADPGILVA